MVSKAHICTYLIAGQAYLAQSPQLYKQMALCADFERVFTIGQGEQHRERGKEGGEERGGGSGGEWGM